GIFICFLLLSENTGYTPQVYRNLCLKLLLVLIGSLAVYFFIDRIIIPAIFNFKKSNYLEAMNKWGQKPFGRIIFDFFLYIYTLTIGHIPLAQKIFNPIIARNAYAWAGSDVYLKNVSRISGNVLLLPATVLFLVNVTLVMRRTIPQGRKLLYLLAGIGIPLCIIILVITGGSWPPLRSQYALPLATAFMLFFLIKKFKKKAAAVVACLTLLVAAYQAQITAQLFYSDQMRYNEDVRLAHELNNLIVKAQTGNRKLPVVLVGRYHMAPRFHANFLQGEVIGRSVFETGTDSAFKTTGRAQAFMKSLGMHFDMPTEAQAEQAYNEAITMPPFPDPLCIKVMRDYVVIRISETLYW
ncbi:MAG: hypothetical protein FWG46_08165, partial [Treponema sp.]|nr:hypothetical protein [Treponema sp.]